MNEQVTPDAMSTQDENNLICEKLLRLKWTWIPHASLFVWADDNRQTFSFISKFDTWAEAGLILDVLQDLGTAAAYSALRSLDATFYNCRLKPAAIRAAALEYIRSLPLSDTPKTDAAARWYAAAGDVVSLDFARAQERRIADMLRAVERAKPPFSEADKSRDASAQWLGYRRVLAALSTIPEES